MVGNARRPGKSNQQNGDITPTDETKQNEAKQDEAAFWRRQHPEAPTPEALRKHLTKFGNDPSISHIASMYGVDPNGSTQPRKRKPLTRAQRERAAKRALAMLEADA
jgi:hypothetical protein